MEPGYSEEKFKQHIRTVVSEAEGDTLEERPLTLDELKELALSMGMREDEWDALQKKAYVHLKLAEDHLKARNFEQAIAEAEQATSINPYIANGNSILAKSYQMLWLEDNEVSAGEKAEYHARKELLTDPNDKVAINVLSAINKKKKIGGKDKKAIKKYLMIGGGVLAFILMLVFIFNQGEKSTENAALENQLIEAQEDVFAKLDLVETAINQRNSMLPDLFAVVEGNHSDLSAVNQEIESLRQQIKQASGTKKFKLESQLDKKITEAKRLVEQYGNPDRVERLMIQIEGAENRIAFEKKNYNDAVKSYNILVKKSKGAFPEYELESYYHAE